MSDANEHCINVFAGNGNFLYKFGNKGEGNGEFINLRHLSVNKAGHLVVYVVGFVTLFYSYWPL